MDTGQSKPHLAVAGSGGMLGSAFCRLLDDRAFVSRLKRSDLENCKPAELADQLFEQDIQYLVNCAADTDVEGAERYPDRAMMANAYLPGLLAQACELAGAELIHFSSTGCYGDWKTEPFTERDTANPTTTHHRSKLEGERLVALSGCKSLTVRTGWLFGGPTNSQKNFVWNRMVEARGKAHMNSDDTQRGCPTLVDDVVEQVWRLFDMDVSGLFNVVAEGSASRFEYVREIISSAGIECDVRPGPAFKREAKVSSNEAALNNRLNELQLNCMPRWKESLRAYVDTLVNTVTWRDLEKR